MAGPPPPTWAVDPDEAGAREIADGIWRLRLPVGWEQITHVNAFLIDGTILVDCGTGGHPTCADALQTAFDRAGHRIEDVEHLVLTHVHTDHMGLAPLVLERSGAQLHAHPDDAHFVEAFTEPGRIEQRRERRARQEGVPERRLEPYRTAAEELEGALAAVTPDHHLTDGDELSGWQVVETPGHCPSHITLFHPERRIAFVGDLICPVFAPWLDYGYSPDPMAETFASLDRLDQLRPALSLPGHGRPITDTASVVADTRASFHERLDATRRALAQGPAGAYELTTRIWGEEPDLAATGHLAEMLAYLRYLRGRGEATRSTNDDGTYSYEETR